MPKNSPHPIVIGLLGSEKNGSADARRGQWRVIWGRELAIAMMVSVARLDGNETTKKNEWAKFLRCVNMVVHVAEKDSSRLRETIRNRLGAGIG